MSRKDLEIEPEAWQISPWLWLKNIFLMLLTCFLILVFLGFVGPGILSPSTIKQDQALIAYDPTVRSHSKNTLTLQLGPIKQNQIILRLSNELISNWEIVNIIPRPQTEFMSDNDLSLIFANNTTENPQIKIIYSPKIPGHVNGFIQVNNDKPISFKQLIFP